MYQMHFLVQMFVYLINFFVIVHYYDYYLTVFFFLFYLIVLFLYSVPAFFVFVMYLKKLWIKNYNWIREKQKVIFWQSINKKNRYLKNIY